MTRRSTGLLLVPASFLALAGMANSATADQAKGRHKKQGDACVWDDGGPDQCNPRQPR